MASAGKHQLLNFMDELIPTIRTALCDRYAHSISCHCSNSFVTSCIDHLFFTNINLRNIYFGCVSADSMPEVRESAGLAFSTLYKVILLVLLSSGW